MTCHIYYAGHTHSSEPEVSTAEIPQEKATQSETTRLLCKIDKELIEVARRDAKSVLRDRGYDGISTYSFDKILNEMKTLCLTVFSILSQMIQFDNSQEKKKAAAMSLIYGIIMFLRCKEMSLVQRVNTVLLTEGDASTELVDRLHKYSFCLSRSMKYTIQEEIGNHFLDRAVELLKQGKTFVFVLDNIDWEVKVHDMRSDNQNTSVHAVATSIVFDRVTCTHLPDDGPKKTLSECNLIDLLTLTEEEIQCTRDRYKIFIRRVLCELFPSFDFLKEILPAHTPCQFPEEMSYQSVVVPLPVLMKDEKKMQIWLLS
ncbi:hypothetical protein OS493_001602 [Desmophyllum pertusum]|uniref:Uncharacterized protein n=1 Tax=Desmophyllum pertusum TaxID=174260 RepID=A0A9X0D1J0_9CNID|nr:hypothetical protein OS493_001602 [Desmophyllum pertusum]